MKKIPTYIINLLERKDRRLSALKQFINKNEFEVNVVNAIKKKEGM